MTPSPSASGAAAPWGLFLPCAAGVETYLQAEARRISGAAVEAVRGGVRLRGDADAVARLNLGSRLAQRVLIELSHTSYRHEQDLYQAASAIAWEDWFGVRQSFKVDVTAHACPLKSLNFAALRIKDALVDRFRARLGERPDVETTWPDVRIHAHLGAEHLTLYIDASGEPLFKRGWREDKGDAPLKETLAAALLAASGWWDAAADTPPALPLYDPCCGSGTIAIEAAQIACGIAPGLRRRFAFEQLRPFAALRIEALKTEVRQAAHAPSARIHGSDVAHRMVDFAQRNAARAGVDHAIEFRGGDALQRLPPGPGPGLLLVNPPYGERIESAGVARGRVRPVRAGRDQPQSTVSHGGITRYADADSDDFFQRLAAHWKTHYAGWTAHVLSPDMKLPGRMRMKESRRVPLYNGPIECRLFRFDIQAARERYEPIPRPSAV